MADDKNPSPSARSHAPASAGMPHNVGIETEIRAKARRIHQQSIILVNDQLMLDAFREAHPPVTHPADHAANTTSLPASKAACAALRRRGMEGSGRVP